MTAAVEFTHVCRHYVTSNSTVKAVDNISLSVAEGEFFSMLGPSGSGKTTCLRLIAGFEQPTKGNIRIFGKEMAGAPPYERAVNTVFQDYALFPHMNVLENVAYGLRVKHVQKVECIQRAEAALEMVALSDYALRRPSQLSGGQRQRVALARAIVNRPRVLLLDEPLGALDLKLREQMQSELKSLHKKLGITFIYVTHDQGEALSMSDRVAVFNQGQIEQIDSPRQLYSLPKTSFVADFVGTANIIRDDFALQLTHQKYPFSIRPEDITLYSATKHKEHIIVDGEVMDIQFHGASTKIAVAVGRNNHEPKMMLWMALPSAEYSPENLPKIQQSITLCWPKNRMVMLQRT